jgi:hypothetical protein
MKKIARGLKRINSCFAVQEAAQTPKPAEASPAKAAQIDIRKEIMLICKYLQSIEDNKRIFV